MTPRPDTVLTTLDEAPPYIEGMIPITGYAEAEEILRSQDFAEGGMEHESDQFRKETLIELDGPVHLPRRRLESQLFARSALRHYEIGLLERSIQNCLDDLKEQRGEDGIIRTNLVSLSRKILLQIASGIIGLDKVETDERTARLAAYQRLLDQAFIVKWSTRDHDELIAEALEVKAAYVREFVGPALERRRGLLAEYQAGRLKREDLPTDLLTLMLLHPSPEWDDDLVVRETILFLAASIGTTTSAVTSAVQDIDRWIQKHPEDAGKLQDTDFLRRLSNEVLRLRPTFPAMIRRALRDLMLKSGRRVREGERFVIPNDAINRDQSVFGPDADEFNPYRQMPPGVHDYGLAFGTGQKNCIGKALVTTVSEAADPELERTMVRMLKAFYRSGIARDYEVAAVRAPTTGEQYDLFPVRFDNL